MYKRSCALQDDLKPFYTARGNYAVAFKTQEDC